MTETLDQKQRRLTRMIEQLIEYAHANGYGLALGALVFTINPFDSYGD